MKYSTKTLAFTGMFTALTYVSTLLAIPNGFGGYINFGDAFILFCATVMNPFSAMIAGGIGAALADLTLGYLVYVPFTLAIKGIMGLFCCLAVKFIIKKERKMSNLLLVVCYFCTMLIMVGGYFLSNLIINGGEIGLGLAQLPFDFIQTAISVLIISVLVFAVKMDKLFLKYYSKD